MFAGPACFLRPLFPLRALKSSRKALGGQAQAAVQVQQAKAGAKAETAFNSFTNAVKRHRANLEQYGGSVHGKGKTAIQSSALALRAAIKEQQELGAYDVGVQALLEQMVADPTSLTANVTGGIASMVGGQSAKDHALTQLNELEAAAIGELQAKTGGGLPQMQQLPPIEQLSTEELQRMLQGAQ